MTTQITEAAEKEIQEFAATTIFSLDAVRQFYQTVGRIPTSEDVAAARIVGLSAITNFYAWAINK